MWVIRPYAPPKPLSVDLPFKLLNTLGDGVSLLVSFLEDLSEGVIEDRDSVPAPPLALCRICERHVPTWWFERHSELCLVEHKTRSDLDAAHENLVDQRNTIVHLLGLMDNKPPLSMDSSPSGQNVQPSSITNAVSTPPSVSSSSSRGSSSSPQTPKLDYRGVPLPLMHQSPNSETSSPPRSPRMATQLGSSSKRMLLKSFNLPKRSPIKLMELLVELCDLAVDINNPELRTAEDVNGNSDVRTHSPQSESKIHRVLNWTSPNIEDPGLLLLCEDTVNFARQKVEAALRLGNTITYFETIRHETEVTVAAVIEDTIEKTALQRENEKNAYDSVIEHSDGEDTDIDDNSSLFSENYLNSDALPNSSTPNKRRPPNSQSLLRHENSFGSDISLSDPRSNAILARSVTPRSLLSESVNVNDNSGPSRASSKLVDHNRIDRRSTLDSQELLEYQLTDLDLNQSASYNRLHKKKSLSNLSTVSSSSQTGNTPAWTSLQRNRIHTSAEMGQSPYTPLSSPLLFPHDNGFPFDALNHRRQSSVNSDMSRPPVSPLLQSTSIPSKATTPSIKDYEIINPISKGAFGSVYLAKKKLTGEYFAIKVLKKADMIAKNQVMNVRAERAIMMSQADSPFVAKLYFTFQSKNYLYLVMEYLNGGDCAALVKVLGGLPEDWAQKYIAEVVLGVEDLHKKGIVHRDLKPDNLLINQDGHLKLTDFGLSRMGMVGRHTHQPSTSGLESNASFDSGSSGTIPSKPMAKALTSPEIASGGSSVSGPSSTGVLTDPAISLVPGYFNLGSKGSARRLTMSKLDSVSTANFKPSFHGSPFSETPKSYDEENMSSNSSEASGSLGSSALTTQLLPNKHIPLFDPLDTSRKFVGTPDYLAPETIRGDGQDEMSDWWSVGCILFEFLYGYPPFHAETPDAVFQNILAHNVQWPELEEADPDDTLEIPQISDDAKDLIKKLLHPDASERLGANEGAEEIKKHPFFESISWSTLWDDEASFIPMIEDPESTDYFDSRGAESQAFPDDAIPEDDKEEQDAKSEHSYSEDSKSGRSSRAGSIESTGVSRKERSAKLPLHIPPHVRDSRNRRLSEPANDDFGNFVFRNLPMLEKANKDTLSRIKTENLEHRNSIAAESHKRGRGLSISANTSFKRPDSPSSVIPRNPSPARNPPPVQSTHSSVSLSPVVTASSSISHSSGPPSASSSVTSPHRKSYSIKPRPSMAVANMSTSPLSIEVPKGKFLGHGFASLSPNLSPSVPSGESFHMPPPPPRTNSIKGQPTPHSPRGLGLHQLSYTESSPELGEQFKKQSVAQRYTKVFDPSPSNSDTEEARSSALIRIQRRRESARRGSTMLMAPFYRPLVILICESNPVWRYSMEKLIKGLNCRFVSVNDAADAIRYATGDVQFDIIFIEFKFPKTNGADVARILHSTSSCNTETPVVCVTNYAAEAASAGRANFSSIITKPPTQAKIAEALERHCCWRPKEAKRTSESKEAPPAIPEVVHEVSLEHGASTSPNDGLNPAATPPPTFDNPQVRKSSEAIDPMDNSAALATPPSDPDPKGSSDTTDAKDIDEPHTAVASPSSTLLAPPENER